MRLSFAKFLFLSAAVHAAALSSRCPFNPPRLISIGDPIPVAFLGAGGAGEGGPSSAPVFEHAATAEAPLPAALVRPQTKTVTAESPRKAKRVKPEAPPSPVAHSNTPPTAEISFGPLLASAPLGPGDGAGAGSAHGFGGGSGGGRSGPMLLSAPRPSYPELAREAGFEGRVLLNVVVERSGRIGNVTLEKSSGRSDCDQAAIATVRERWRFAPATLAGIPVAWSQKIAVVYKLQ